MSGFLYCMLDKAKKIVPRTSHLASLKPRSARCQSEGLNCSQIDAKPE